MAGVLQDGTPVGVQPNVGCGRCASCALGLENRCPDHVDIGIQRDGGLAEWIVVPEGHVVPLDGFPFELAPSIEPLACCLHAVGMLDVAEGDLAVVVGAGTLGIIGMWALQAAGARVAVVQRSEARRRLADELGADAVLEPGDDVVAALGALPGAALVTAPGVEALSWAIDHVDVGGRVHAFAGTPGGAPVDANVVHYRHLRLVGSTGSTVQDYRRARDLARSGAVPLSRMPSRTVAMDDVPRILLDDGPDPRMLRVVVRPVGWRQRWFVGRSGDVAEHPDDPIRVALIGYGLAGSVFHAPLIHATSGLELSHIVTSSQQRSAAARQRYPDAAVVSSVADVFTADVDAIVVATPNDRLHAPLALRALENGLGVVIDKPMAVDSQQAEAVVRRAQETEFLLYRVPEPPLGRGLPDRRATDRRRLAGRRSSPGVAVRTVATGRRCQNRWRESADPALAGGLLFDLGSHLVDQAMQPAWAGGLGVYAEVSARRAGAVIDDDVFVALEHGEGVRSHLWMSVLAAIGGPRMRLLGLRAAFEKFGLDVQEQALSEGARPGGPAWGREPPERWGRLSTGEDERAVETEPGAYEEFYRGVAASLRGDAPPPVDPSDSVMGLEIIEAAQESARTRRVIALG